MRFCETNKLVDVISSDYALLLLIGRFGIKLGFGDKSVRTVCTENGVDVKTFLAVANYVATGDSSLYHDISIRPMMNYLQQSHQYYMDNLLPELRLKLVALSSSVQDDKVASLVLKLFDKYASDVRKHLDYESTTIFGYTNMLLEGHKGDGAFNLTQYLRQHDSIDLQLTELKTVLLKYFPSEQMMRALNSVLTDIYSCEKDLNSHCDIEDNLFMPAVIELENEVNQKSEL